VVVAMVEVALLRLLLLLLLLHLPLLLLLLPLLLPMLQQRLCLQGCVQAPRSCQLVVNVCLSFVGIPAKIDTVSTLNAADVCR
jgi:hypothetical protein